MVNDMADSETPKHDAFGFGKEYLAQVCHA